MSEQNAGNEIAGRVMGFSSDKEDGIPEGRVQFYVETDDTRQIALGDDVYLSLAQNTRAPSVGAGEYVRVKPLDWRDMTFRGVEEWCASHAFGSYTVKREDNSSLPFVCRPFPCGPSNYATADEAKAAAEADYATKVGRALSPSSAHPAQGLVKALAELTDCFLEKHGCFPLDNARWKAAMTEAYRLVGQPMSPERAHALSEGNSK